MHFGYEPGTLLADADLVIALESDVPWIPHLQQPAAGARIVHVAEDPIFSRYPMRSFPSDLSVQAGVVHSLEALIAALEPRLQAAEPHIAARRARLTERMHVRRAQLGQGFGRRGDTFRRNICHAALARRSATTPSSSTNIRCARTIVRASMPARFIRSGRRAVWAGASAPRSAPSWPRPTS